MSMLRESAKMQTDVMSECRDILEGKVNGVCADCRQYQALGLFRKQWVCWECYKRVQDERNFILVDRSYFSGVYDPVKNDDR